MPGSAFLRGDRVSLRPVERDDLDFLRKYVNDPDVRKPLTMRWPINAEQQEEFFEEQISGDDRVDLLVCAEPAAVADGGRERGGADAEDVPDGLDADDETGLVRLGNVSLFRVREGRGTAEMSYWLAPAAHGRGFGSEAVGLLLDHAFGERRFHRVTARVLETNAASQGLVESLGFTHEGTLRDEEFQDGAHVDVRYYGLLADEWADR